MSDETSSEVTAPELNEETGTDTTEYRYEQYPPDHPLVKRLEALKAELKDTRPKAKRLAEIEEASKSEAERSADRIAAESSRADAAEAALLRYQIADEVGIPSKAVKLLAGVTREEIQASAKDVLELIGDTGKPRSPKPDPNQGRTPPEATTPAAQFASFLSQQLKNA